MFRRINILPQWAIFFIDIFISILSLWIAYLIKNEFNFKQIDKVIFFKNAMVLVGLSSVVFVILKTYEGIIRLTTIQDAFKMFVAVALINAGFILVYLIASTFFQKSFISITILVLNGFIGFVLLIGYRIGIRHLFAYFKNKLFLKDITTDSKNIIIFGANEEGITVKRTLEQDTKVAYRIIAFLDEDTGKSRKSIAGVRIYHLSDLPEIILSDRVDELIIAAEDLSIEKKNEVVDVCLDKGIKVLLTPPVKAWINGQLSAKQIHKVKIEELLERAPIIINNEIIDSQLKNKRILVTGAAGSIGNELVRQLARFSPAVIILVDIAESALYEAELSLGEQFRNSNFLYFIGDIKNYQRMEYIFSECKPHYVYHAAAYKHVPMMEMHPYEAVSTNVIGTKNIADLSLKYRVQKFVMISSDKSVNPTNVMGATKRIAEVYVQSLYHHQLSVVAAKETKDPSENTTADSIGVTRFITTRFGNVLGSNGSVIPRFEAQIRNGGPVTITHPEISRYFMTIPEACQLVLEAGSMGKGGEIFVFNMGKMVKIKDLATKMIRLSGFTPGVDIDLKYIGLRPGEKLHEELLNTEENTMPTYHSQILIAKVKEYDFEDVNRNMHELTRLVETGKDEMEIVRMMKKMIPEYLSNNSVFENLDAEKGSVMGRVIGQNDL